ncbi:2-keto-3-deoxygluconate permease [Nocardioides bruguierae]|uniref:2-keto-3-deoxygluconate permease n=1 Tax=Nocardioides bruguierae TaxID=2945102 RepID=UPI002021EB6D|nr:2-keto-3-deoxygluconate permease [Nocardioides bruguierae]MCL8026870.1 2-keto-3-deoxygluconate permease [Nocardioides bruguierae]
MDSLFRTLAKVPGALLIVPLFLAALINTVAPQVLEIGSFTTALFKDGAVPLIAMFFFVMGSQIRLGSVSSSLEKGVVMLVGKYVAAIVVGLSVAWLTPDGSLFGLVPLAIIAAMGNSNGAMYIALTGQFGNRSDKGAVAVLSINDGPLLTLIALGAAGLADFSAMALLAVFLPILLGFTLGNTSDIAREFLAPGEKIILPFALFAIGAGIDLTVFATAGAVGFLLGIMTIVLSGGLAMLALQVWHVARRHPKPTRNVIGGACEATTAGNAIATPAAVALADPSYQAVQGVATTQVASAVVVTAVLIPFVVVAVSKWQARRGVSPEAEEALYEERRAGRSPSTEPDSEPEPGSASSTPAAT